MASILFTAVASVAGAGLPSIAQTVSGVAAGAIGNSIDGALFGRKTTRQIEGPRLESLSVLSATEGSPIMRGWGRFRISGEIIWATRLREDIITTTETTGGGKGGVIGGGGGSEVTTTEFRYFANFAIGLVEGEAGYLNRVWADGKELNLAEYVWRFYNGSETQTPDSLIATKEGSGNVPGYRGLVYIVLEDFPLQRFGNRIPQLQFEILKPVKNAKAESSVRGVNIIPGSTEFGYDSTIVEQSYGSEQFGDLDIRPENNHLSLGISDFQVSLDHLEVICPNLESVCLVVAWFGDDLRAGSCTIRPRVENRTKETTPNTWGVANLTRSTATLVSQIGSRPAFGGTPDDDSVKRAIAAIKAKGWKVMFYPFIMMDIPSGNSLPDPYSDNAGTNGQSIYPWRGRITPSPAFGFAGSVDKTAAVATQVNSFYSGTWGYENFIEHYATLCQSAGGVDYFNIGTEMRGLTFSRDAAGSYPFVNHLKVLAASVSTIMPSAKIGYAADWSEYHSHRPADGSGDVYFHLDPLWSDGNIDFIGIDNYMPLSDWRDGDDHLDAQAGYNSIYNIDYLKSQVEGGEYYDYFYADDVARESQTRTAIVDVTYSEPWVFGNKRIREWWENTHHDRPLGVRNESATDWVAEGKPIFFTEFGCSAIDKGANQPNVFVDPNSSESNLPHFSTGGRDDMIQRQFVRALNEYWQETSNNPLSSVYSGRMIDVDNMHVWTWDARPTPVFPYDRETYVDGANWEVGHWVSNRFGSVPVADFLTELIQDYDLDGRFDFSNAYGVVDGFVIDRVLSFREATNSMELLFFFDFQESSGKVVARTKHELNRVATLTSDEIVDAGNDTDPVRITRSQQTDLPAVAKLRFINADSSFKSAAVEARRQTVAAVRTSIAEVPVVYDMARAQQSIDRWLFSTWAENELAELIIQNELLKIEAGDVIGIPFQGETREMRVIRAFDGPQRRIEALAFDRAAFSGSLGAGRTQPVLITAQTGAAALALMDLPMLTDNDAENAGYVAAFASPWSGVSLYRSITDSNYQLNTALSGPAIMGFTRFDFFSGPTSRWDKGNQLFVEILGGSISGKTDLEILGGANACAVENADGEWEILQFVNATLENTLQYRLERLLRGQRGTEYAMRSPVEAGARVVFFNLATLQVAMQNADVENEYYWRHGPSTQDISSDFYSTQQFTFTGRGRDTYSPVHVRGRFDVADNLTISWIRRTRIDGDNWGYTVEVPLSETSEMYEVDILNEGSVVRTFSSSTPSIIYTAAEQATDFGSVQNEYDLRVYQLSPTQGRGTGRQVTIFPF